MFMGAGRLSVVLSQKVAVSALVLKAIVIIIGAQILKYLAAFSHISVTSNRHFWRRHLIWEDKEM